MLGYLGWTAGAWGRLVMETHKGNVDEARITLHKVYELHRNHEKGQTHDG